MDSTVNLSFRYSQSDYVRALRAHYVSHLRLRLDAIVAVGLAGIGVYSWPSLWGVVCVAVSILFVLMQGYMKKNKSKSEIRRTPEDTMRTEYDFSKAVRGVTVARYAEGTNVVLLDPDLSEIFPNARAVNEALRTFVRLNKPRASVRVRKTANGTTSR